MPTLWTNRDFWLLCLAYAVSTFGDHVAQMSMMGALGFSGRDPTGKLHLSCWLTLAFFLPYITLGPINGWLADRWPRRLLLISADICRAVLMVLVPLVWFGLLLAPTDAAGLASPWQVVSDSTRPYWQGALPYLLIGVFAALFSPARAALVPSLVHESRLVQANALLSGAGVIFSGIGLLAGGMLAIRFLGPSFLVTATTFLFSAGCVFLIRTRRPPGATHALSVIDPTRSPPPPAPTIRAGLSYILTHRVIFRTILLSGLFWGLVAVVSNGVSGGAQDESSLGSILAMFTFGMLAGAILINVTGHRLKEPRLIVLTLLGVGVGLTLYSRVCLAQTGLLAHILGFQVGLFAVGLRIGVETLLQRLAPDRLRGRLFGICDVVSMTFFLLFTLGLLLLPRVGDYLPGIFAGCGLLTLGVGGYAQLQRWKSGHAGPLPTRPQHR